ncbi:ABC transporter substrate-binding protein [Xanthomonas sp. XNM01]|uniref:heme/hemin ABC transporter substrate-binding protein n=1 Tax=Xanthomonas sp. XNM01 TaxID=2769289 RepID=UPI001783C2FE|nr:ABC transporter substrate-binding protein [Xanthomonas sp. XNM01]MBD9370809.1 ABC transporter substrate-binding protein [Xanthomonas sp. XNM01]
MKMIVRTSPLLLGAALLLGCGQPPAAPAPADGNAAPPAAAPADAAPLPAGWRHIVGRDVPDATDVPRQQLPATVRSDDDVEVTVSDSTRTIAGGDDVIAVMEALGLDDQVYAAPERSATEAGRRAPKHFLFNRNTGAEGVLSLDATLFVGNSLRRHAASGLAAKLRDAGLATVVIDDLQPAPDKVRKTAAAFGLAAQGEALATQVQAQMDRAAQIAAAHPHTPRVIQVSASGAGGQPTVAGRDNAAAAIIRLAGGINIGDEAGVANYSALSNEGVVAAAPDVILVTEQDLQLFGGEAGLWQAYPTLKQTPAGAAGRVWVMPDVQLKSTSVASGAGAVALAEALAELAEQGAQ